MSNFVYISQNATISLTFCMFYFNVRRHIVLTVLAHNFSLHPWNLSISVTLEQFLRSSRRGRSVHETPSNLLIGDKLFFLTNFISYYIINSCLLQKIQLRKNNKIINNKMQFLSSKSSLEIIILLYLCPVMIIYIK